LSEHERIPPETDFCYYNRKTGKVRKKLHSPVLEKTEETAKVRRKVTINAGLVHVEFIFHPYDNAERSEKTRF
jgi:hypothetical protein